VKVFSTEEMGKHHKKYRIIGEVKMAKIKLGINNCFAVKRWPEPEEWCKIIGKELGLRYVQFSFDLLDPGVSQPLRRKMTEEIKKAVKKYGLEIHTTFAGLASYSFNKLLHPDIGVRHDALRWCEEAILMTAEMGAHGTGGPLGALSMRDFDLASRKKNLVAQLIEMLQHLTQLAALEGQEFFLWEPTPVAREICHTIEETRGFYKEVNKGTAVPVKFCLDVGHQCATDTTEKDRDPYVWLEELAPISPVVHIQQTDGKLDSHWPFTKEFNKKGIIEPKRIIQSIQRSEAEEVFLFLEILHPFEADEKKVLEDIKESVEYWKSISDIEY